jgi:hypothetical protein
MRRHRVIGSGERGRDNRNQVRSGWDDCGGARDRDSRGVGEASWNEKPRLINSRGVLSGALSMLSDAYPYVFTACAMAGAAF